MTPRTLFSSAFSCGLSFLSSYIRHMNHFLSHHSLSVFVLVKKELRIPAETPRCHLGNHRQGSTMNPIKSDHENALPLNSCFDKSLSSEGKLQDFVLCQCEAKWKGRAVLGGSRFPSQCIVQTGGLKCGEKLSQSTVPQDSPTLASYYRALEPISAPS